MNFTEKVGYTLKRYGMKNGTKYLMSRLTGSYKTEAALDSVFYILNHTLDIQNFPKATGEMRKLQLCDTEILKIFHTACEKYGLTYWMDYGTLLGAVRHGGFIPWDDDLDVSMPRVDYERAFQILPQEMKKFGIDVYEFSNSPMASMGFTFKHWETGVWLDIFPADCYYYEKNLDEIEEVVNREVYKYRRNYGRSKKHASREKIVEKKNRILSNPTEPDQINVHGILIHEPEFQDRVQLYHDISEVFPLQMITFEDGTFYGPSNTDRYLKRIYGRHYMEFPRSGISHHYSKDGQLYEWAEGHGLSLDDVLQDLCRIRKQMEAE